MLAQIRTRLACVALALALFATVTGAQQPSAFTAGAQTAPLTQPVPVDPRITTATLPNGLRYYIRANRTPRNRAELRLVVNAGSVLEDDDQRGLAHFVEHMSFNGTTHFPKQDVISFMQAIGMRFGAHVNAHTSFDETVYQLQIPTDSVAVIDRSLLIMEDWAHNVTFDPAEIDKERGVILEEWRLGLGAGARMQDKQFPVLLKDSRYADRLPIGKPEIIRTFSYDTLKRFYNDWYRPDLMAVIAVGDFDPAVVEGLVKTRFSAIPPAKTRRARPVFDVPDQPATAYSVATDPEATATTVGVITKMKARDQTTIGSYRQSLVERLFAGLLSSRFGELADKPNPPFLAAETGRDLFVRTAEATSMNALVTESGIESGLTALFTEANRVLQFGFTATELEREKLNMRRGLERAMVDEEAHTSDLLADEYIRNFNEMEPIPGIPYEYALYQRFIPTITLAEVNAVAKDWLRERNRVVMVNAPEKKGVTMPDQAKLAAAIKAATGKPLTAYVDEVSKLPLLDPLPAPGKIARTTARDALGITEWELSNGVRVVLMPTTFKQDEILFRAVSPGGTSLASDQDFVAAETADEVIGRGGLGKLDQSNLEKLLAGKTVGVRPEIRETDEGLRGGASRRDLESMFQLIYLTFTQPRADAEAFRALTGQLTATLANRQALPDAAFNDAVDEAVSQGHLRARPLSPALIGQMNLDRSLAFYKDRFADASDFTFVFVGSFNAETIRPLVERYLASLPALNRREAAKDVGMRTPAGIVERQVVKGVDPKSEVSVTFSGPFQNDQMRRIVARAMSETLEGNLQRTLREDLGGTYGVSVRADFKKRPLEEYRLTIEFACDPARMDALVTALFQMIDRFKQTGPTVAQVSDAHTALVRDLELNMRDNRYLLDQLAFKYEYSEDPAEIFNIRQLYDQLSVTAIRDAARAMLNTDRYVKVTLVPAVVEVPK
ncbi:MAG TPA: insulinase family protein [Vicinamibacterales bacterium]|nr:insulinase family protein [Vicinamibacterales bacterium]